MFAVPGVIHAATLLVVGDSLSAGYGINASAGWVALLDKRLIEQGYDYNVINASISGETSTSGKVRMPTLLQTHHPDLVIIELGANDGLRGLPTKQIQANLADMINTAQHYKVKTLLIGMKLPPNYGEQYTTMFSQLFAELAKTYRLPFVPFLLEKVALNPQLLQGDNLHPNAQAQPLLLDTIWPQLKPLLHR